MRASAAVAALVLAPAIYAQPGNAKQAAPGYAGSEACAVCHQDLVKEFAKTRHQALEKEPGRGWVGKSCEACHGSGIKHSETTDLADIINPAKQKAIVENNACLACHVNQTAPVGRILSGHAKDQVACSQCHKVHPKPGELLYERRKPQINALCGGCHQTVWASFQSPHGHRLREGAMTCTDCHNPHNPSGYAARRVAFGNEPSCFNCHGALRGPFVHEHAPVRLEGCGSCHVPHGSPNPKLLNRHEVALTCLECHGAIGMTQAGATPPAFHDLRTARFRNCTTCHRKIHGSQVDRSLQR